MPNRRDELYAKFEQESLLFVGRNSGYVDAHAHDRASELLISLNTNVCLSGKSTLARFCSFMGHTGNNCIQAMQKFERTTTFKTRKSHRISSTLRYLKTNKFTFTNRFEGARSP